MREPVTTDTLLRFSEFLTESKTTREIRKMNNRQHLKQLALQLEQNLFRHANNKNTDLHAYIGDVVEYFGVLLRLEDLK